MKVLVVGSGGREHALAWKLSRSSAVSRVFAAPGNAGIAGVADCRPVAADDVSSLASLAQREAIDLTVVGPEAALVAGIVDEFSRRGLRIVGPTKSAARLEGSKVYTKEFLRRHGIPTADFAVFTDADRAIAHIRAAGAPVVVKADGLAAGKGVVVCGTVAEAEEAVRRMLIDREFGDAGSRVIVEEALAGEEASYLAFADGERILPMPTSQDHKRVFDGDQGPNTGGMGAYSPAPVVTPALEQEIIDTVMRPTVQGMASEGSPYRGILYAGLMITPAGIRVLEYNCRFGDPEAQPILMRMASDIVEPLAATVDGTLGTVTPRWDERPAVCVVMASGGYPGAYNKGYPIEGLGDAAAVEGVEVFHAGTAVADGRIVTAGGRVLGVTAVGDTVARAAETAYRAAALIRFSGAHYRRDIAHRAINRIGGVP